jgi:hypothetical protein
MNKFVLYFTMILVLLPNIILLENAEQTYIAAKNLHLSSEMEPFIGESIPEGTRPTIGFCFSGGGYRSMISSLGFMIGAESTGLLRLGSYISTVSGSTWGLMTFLTRCFAHRGLTLAQFRDITKAKVSQDFWHWESLHWENILKRLEHKYHTYGCIEPADLWGALLADRLLGDLPDGGQNYSFKKIRNLLSKNCGGPYPLFNAIIKNVLPYEWFEVNPFYSKSSYLRTFVDTQLLGNKFRYGHLVDPRPEKLLPEESLGFYMGIFGCPFDANVGDILLQIGAAVPERWGLRDWFMREVTRLIEHFKLEKHNFLATTICNPAFDLERSSYQAETLTLADAGFSCNLGFPPLLNRNVDIIICCDASSDACKPKYPELFSEKQYADTHELPFPSLRYAQEVAPNILIFDKTEEGRLDPRVPAILYLRNPIMHSTFKLQYSTEEFDPLCNYMQSLAASPACTQAVRDLIRQRINLKLQVPQPPAPLEMATEPIPVGIPVAFPDAQIQSDEYQRLLTPVPELPEEHDDGFWCGCIPRLW